jgi:predicted nucleic acid-binding protein
MRLVVDASVAIKWFVDEGDSADALMLRTLHRLLAPDLLMAEIGNVLSTKVRLGDMDPDKAERAAEALLNAGVDFKPMAEFILPALRMAARLQHPAYDCFYLAMAQTEGCRLVTADQRFLRAIAAHGDESQKAACLSLAGAATR